MSEVAGAFNIIPQEAKPGRSPWVRGHPGLHKWVASNKQQQNMRTKCCNIKNVTKNTNFDVHHKIYSSEKLYKGISYIISMCVYSLEIAPLKYIQFDKFFPQCWNCPHNSKFIMKENTRKCSPKVSSCFDLQNLPTRVKPCCFGYSLGEAAWTWV